jgi:hypothetical protein
MLREILTANCMSHALPSFARALRRVLFAIPAILFPLTNAHADIVTRFTRLTGNYNYVVTGGSLRTQSNAGNPCTIGASNTQTLSGIPVGATRVAAYL